MNDNNNIVNNLFLKKLKINIIRILNNNLIMIKIIFLRIKYQIK